MSHRPALDVTIIEGDRQWVVPIAAPVDAPAAPIEDLVLHAPGLSPSDGNAGGSTDWRRCHSKLVSATVPVRTRDIAEALSRVEIAGHEIGDIRVVFRGPHVSLVGRIESDRGAVPFSIAVEVRPGVPAPRFLRFGLADVRIYGLSPMAPPLVGAAIAKAIAGAFPQSWPARTRGALLDLDVLHVALAASLVRRGWRLPKIEHAAVDDLTLHGGGKGESEVLRLRFVDGERDEPKGARREHEDGDFAGSPRRPSTLTGIVVEGEPLPPRLTSAESHLWAGDLGAAATEFARALNDDPNDRAAMVRLLGIRAAQMAIAGRPGASSSQRLSESLSQSSDDPAPPSPLPDLGDLARTARDRWPALVAGWLAGAAAASTIGSHAEAAALFSRAAELADLEGDLPSATLAREAARAAETKLTQNLRAANDLRRAAGELETHGRWHAALTAYLAVAEQDSDAAADVLRAAEQLQQAGELEAATAGVRRLLELQPENAAAWAALTDLAVQRQAWDEADALFARRLTLTGDPYDSAALVAERARIRMLGPGGAAAALATLRELPVTMTPEEGLVVRADLAERLGDVDDAREALGELRARARVAGDREREKETSARIAALSGSPSGSVASGPTMAPLPAEDEDISIPALTEAMAGLYDREPDFERRSRALAALVDTVEDMPPKARPAAYAALGELAEARGDLARAELAFWRAARDAPAPQEKARFLTAHARVLLPQGNTVVAEEELNAALALQPNCAEALALLADRTFQARQFERARQLYDELYRSGDAAALVPRELLMLRRGFLAHRANDLPVAEMCYREAAVLNPHHLEARQALAEIAIARQDPRAAAQRLEEVVRLLPPDALEPLLEARERLGRLHVELADWESARHYLELVAGQAPARPEILELLIGVYVALGNQVAAAAACERLSRLYLEPRRRAEALYRQGEILSAHGDAEAAFNAYLRSSDLDPAFAPTAERLVARLWTERQWKDVLDIARALRRASGALSVGGGTRARIVLAAAFAGRDPTPLEPSPWKAADTLGALAELGARRPGQPDQPEPVDIGPVLPLVRARIEPVQLAQALALLADADPDNLVVRNLLAMVGAREE